MLGSSNSSNKTGVGIFGRTRIDMKRNIMLIGLGYWGKNLLHNFNDIGALKYAVDLDPTLFTSYREQYSDISFITNCYDGLADPDIEGVVIATTPDTHFHLAMQAMMYGKHVFIEKPITLDSWEAEKLVATASRFGLKILVVHVFLYASEIIKLKEIIQDEAFGKLLYIYTNRLKLGKIQKCGVIADLMPHDVSIVNFLTDSTVDRVSAVAYNQRFDEVADTAIVNLITKNDVVAVFNLSWLVPHKTRTIMLVGEKQTVVCDSMSKTIRIYNSNVSVENKTAYYAEHLLNYKFGDIVEPFVEFSEPLRIECLDFLDSIRYNRDPKSDGQLGLDVVKAVTAAEKSVTKGATWVKC
jgi:predicted dehydrogenase